MLFVALTGAAAADAALPRGFVGTFIGAPLNPQSVSDAKFSAQLDQMVSSGVENLRFAIYWSATQPYASFNKIPSGLRGQFASDGVDQVPTDFRRLDKLIGAAADRGLTLFPTVLGAPAWDGRRASSMEQRVPKRNGPYGNFLKALIHRYGPHGTLWAGRAHRSPIRLWEIWNEPNERSLWPVQPFYRSYASLLRDAYKAVKSADRRATVVLPGFPNFSWEYVDQLYRQRGFRNSFDAAGIHPYTAQPDGVITIISRLRDVMNRHGDSGKSIYDDEFGWPSSVGQTQHLYGFETDEAGQAKNVSAVLPLLARARSRLRIMGFDYYTWVGIEHRDAYTFDFSGLERYSHGQFVSKPALDAFSQAALTLEGCRSKAVATRCRS
jgi:polysaccharide biosynthesis protein PslG